MSAQPTEEITDGVPDATVIRLSLRRSELFATIFERHFAAVYRFAARRAGADLGEEVAAETFVRAFDRRDRYDLSYADARPWLLGIASNVLRRHWRTERRRLEAQSELVNQPARQGSDVPGRVSPGLARALHKLPRGQREVLLLYALGELSYEEIAQAIDVPIGTVRSRLARARRRLGEFAKAPGRRQSPERPQGKETQDA